MYMNMSFFLFSGFLKIDINKFSSCFVNFSEVWWVARVIYVTLGVVDVILNKKKEYF